MFPFPFPLLLEVRIAQEELLTAVQAHPDGAEMLTAPAPPEEEKDWDAGEIV